MISLGDFFPKAWVLGSGRAKWPLDAREPLPPFPKPTSTQPPPPEAGCWTYSPLQYTTLPFTPPDKPDVDFHRGQFQPWLPDGVKRVYPDLPMILSWDLVKMDVADQVALLEDYSKHYTHYLLSIAQARTNFGVDLPTFLACARRVKAAGLFLSVVGFGGDGETWEDIQPWLDALYAEGLIDILCVAWQADRAYSPMDLTALTFKASAWARPKSIRVAIHWINDACAWWNPADEDGTWQAYGIKDRWTYQQVMDGKVNFHYMQVDTEAPIADDRERQGGLTVAIQSVLRSLRGQKLVWCEYDTQAQFDAPTERPERFGDLKGFLGMCVQWGDRWVEGGYMGGARRPDGSTL